MRHGSDHDRQNHRVRRVSRGGNSAAAVKTGIKIAQDREKTGRNNKGELNAELMAPGPNCGVVKK